MPCFAMPHAPHSTDGINEIVTNFGSAEPVLPRSSSPAAAVSSRTPQGSLGLRPWRNGRGRGPKQPNWKYKKSGDTHAHSSECSRSTHARSPQGLRSLLKGRAEVKEEEDEDQAGPTHGEPDPSWVPRTSWSGRPPSARPTPRSPKTAAQPQFWPSVLLRGSPGTSSSMTPDP